MSRISQTEEQLIQEKQYQFPYHYIPTFDDGYLKLYVYWSWGINYICAIDFLIERIQVLKFDNLIDIGCGDGRFIRELSKRMKKKIIGIDQSQQAINLAKALNPGLEFIKHDILCEKPLGDYDVVTLVEVLEHIPPDDVEQFLLAIAALQKTGGYFVLTVPHSNRTTQKKHYQHFDSQKIQMYLHKHYEIQEIVFFDKRPWYLKYLRGIMKNRFFILNHARTLNTLYKFYKNNLFVCSESECSRMYVIATKK